MSVFCSPLPVAFPEQEQYHAVDFILFGSTNAELERFVRSLFPSRRRHIARRNRVHVCTVTSEEADKAVEGGAIVLDMLQAMNKIKIKSRDKHHGQAALFEA